VSSGICCQCANTVVSLSDYWTRSAFLTKLRLVCFVIKGVVDVYERRDAGQRRESSVSVVTASTD